MSRKNKTLRAFLHQTQNPTIEEAWNCAWKHAQKVFHARSMRDLEKRVADLQTECGKLRKIEDQYRRLLELGEDFHWENILRVDISDFPSRAAAIDAVMQEDKL